MFDAYLQGSLGNHVDARVAAAFPHFDHDEPLIPEPGPENRRRYRTIWISDIHLGTAIAPPDLFFGLPRPIQLYVGRVAVEKNIEAFLRSAHPGAKVVVGDGPALARLQATFPDAHFLGKQSALALAACHAGADVFVFPSRTDTFELVMIEALACGTPVAAYPVAGPLDVLTPETGVMAERLEDAIAGALALDREKCLAHARSFSWEASVDQFLAALEPGATGATGFAAAA